MKTKFFLLTFLFLFLTYAAFPQVLPGFYESYAVAAAAAKQDGQILMIDFYTDWCQPCKKLDKEVYGANDFYSYTQKMACVKVNYESEEGKKIGEQYDVSSFPTVVFVNSNGEEIERITSYYAKDRYMADVDRIIEGKNVVGTMEAKYPDEISYGELFHLSLYFARRYYVKEKRDRYYQKLMEIDPDFEKDSTLLITNLLYQTQLAVKDHTNLDEMITFVNAHPEKLYQAELALRIVEALLAKNEKSRATTFYEQFTARFDDQGDKHTQKLLKQMQKLL